jgi:nucleoside-diphosphate-sugar epimerase
MKVLVAGGAGYVGCVLVRELLSRGHVVRVCDRLFFGDEGLADVRSRIELKVEDIRRISTRHLEGMDAVINLAGISSDPTAEFKPELTHEMNVVGAIHLAETSKRAGVRRYVLASSCSVYDPGLVAEELDVPLDEESRITPTSAYAKSKVEAEQALLTLADGAFCPVVLRKGTVYGPSPRMRYDLVINTLLKDALSRGVMTLKAGGEVWRPVVAVTDAAVAYVVCLEAEERLVAAQIFNLVYRNLRVSEMALRVKAALAELGIAADIRADYSDRPVRSYRVSGKKLASTLGVLPTDDVGKITRQAALQARQQPLSDLDHPRHYNIRWFEHLESEHRRRNATATPFDVKV